MNEYKHEGKALDKFIAAELIIKTFNGKQEVERKIIEDTIIEIHNKGGGKPPSSKWKTTAALDALKALQFADNPNRGYWNFLPLDKMITRLKHFKTIRFDFRTL